MKGSSMFDAIMWQRAAWEASHQCTRPQGENSTQTSGAILKVDDDSSFWIGGVHYHSDSRISTTIAEMMEPAMPDQGEFPDWVLGNSADVLLDTNEMFITSIDQPETALLSHPSGLPFFLDSGASSHISCISLDFTSLTMLDEPCKILGVGNASVYAVGVGSIELCLPETDAQLILQNALFMPEAGICLVSIHQLNQLGYTTVFCSGCCQLSNRKGKILADCASGPSNLYALPSTPMPVAISSNVTVALPSLQTIPNLETWHRCLGHANHRIVVDMA